MEPLTLTNSDQIMKVLSEIVLKGRGFCTDCLLVDVMDAGLIAPDFLTASGEDPDAYYQERSPAWATYHIRQGKNVFAVYGGKGVERRCHSATTP